MPFCTLQFPIALTGEHCMSAIAAFKRLSGHQRIGGGLVRSSGGTSIGVIDPATEQHIGEIADATPADIDQAVAVANAAQRAWRTVNFTSPPRIRSAWS